MNSSATSSTALQSNFSSSSSSSLLASNTTSTTTTTKLDGICKRLWSSKCQNGRGTKTKEKFRCSDFTIDHLLLSTAPEGRQSVRRRNEQQQTTKTTVVNGTGTLPFSALSSNAPIVNNNLDQFQHQMLLNRAEQHHQQMPPPPFFVTYPPKSTSIFPMGPPLILAPPNYKNWGDKMRTTKTEEKEEQKQKRRHITNWRTNKKAGDEAEFEQCRSNGAKNGMGTTATEEERSCSCSRPVCKLKKRTHFHCNCCDQGFSSKQRLFAHLQKHS